MNEKYTVYWCFTTIDRMTEENTRNYGTEEEANRKYEQMLREQDREHLTGMIEMWEISLTNNHTNEVIREEGN